jgi:hypothetical protein
VAQVRDDVTGYQTYLSEYPSGNIAQKPTAEFKRCKKRKSSLIFLQIILEIAPNLLILIVSPTATATPTPPRS